MNTSFPSILSHLSLSPQHEAPEDKESTTVCIAGSPSASNKAAWKVTAPHVSDGASFVNPVPRICFIDLGEREMGCLLYVPPLGIEPKM